ncbi:MAG TPA: PhzF family phenazine biosynthesis protein, partial [Kouleothrix sp.]|nr:PhzF family phenazine biosynthesis protein [Kouleothrix sp.]
RKPGEAAYAEFDTPKLPEPLSGPTSTERMADALGLSSSEIGFENHRPTRYSAGVPYTFVPVRDLSAIARAKAVTPFWDAAFGPDGAYLYCRETVHTRSGFHARMFAPDLNNEDPATGSAAAAFSAVVHRFDDIKDGERKLLIEQGYEMGRPSEIALELVVAGGRLRERAGKRRDDQADGRQQARDPPLQAARVICDEAGMHSGVLLILRCTSANIPMRVIWLNQLCVLLRYSVVQVR